MTDESPAHRIALPLIAILIGVVSCNWLAWHYWDPTLIMNDGVGYLSTASNWLAGNGFSTNALIYLPHFDGRMPASETVWPIGFPSVIAAFSVFGLPLETTALVVNLAAHALSALMIYIILRRCRVGRLASLVSATVFYFTTEPWHLALELLSEPFFALVVLTTVALLPDADRFTLRRLVLCGLLMAACTSIRYSAVITAVSFAVGMGLYFLLQSQLSGWRVLLARSLRLAVFTLVSLSGFLVLQWRIYSLSGNLNRDTGTDERQDIISTINQFAEQSSVLVGFRDGWLFSGDTDKWLFFLWAFLLIAVSAIGLYASLASRATTQPNGQLPEQPSAGARHYASIVVYALLSHAVFFCSYLFYCRLSDSPLPVSSRYLYQVYPGLFVVFCLLAARALDNLTNRQTASRALKGALIAIIALYIGAQLNLLPVIKEHTQSGDEAADVLTLPLASGGTLADVVTACVGAPQPPGESPVAHSLWSNEGVKLHQSTGANTITYTSIYSNRVFDFQTFQDNIDTYNINLFVFINNQRSQRGNYRVILDSIKRWLESHGYAPIALQHNQLTSGATVDIFSGQLACDKAH